ncbi:uncharacterized protein LOC133466345 [Phyllopteryx taeniolatus]|uniref:uncharacterized protein LOC133466345 n=1 Tax=Phyllopteryx taeniolatus TaxID=161469 RepID=UPI002AD3C410|nr:uncharacterized protein LOC133466345 [Phyllopteryx taeniolatus]
MHLKAKRYHIVVFLLSTILTITLPYAICKPMSHYSHLSLNLTSLQHKDNSEMAKSHNNNFSPEDAKRHLLLSSRQVKDSTTISTMVTDNFQNNGRTWSQTFNQETDQKPKHNMASSSETAQTFDKPCDEAKKMGREETSVSVKLTNEDCSSGQIQHVVYGKFFISGQLEANIPHLDRQSHSDVAVHPQGKGKARMPGEQLGSSEETWQKLQPEVHCADDAMTLTVRRRRAVQLLLDRENDSSIRLSQLPPRCGYSVETTWRDLSLIAQYSACHVTQQGDSYVLPLLWRGTPVKMSCPVSPIKPGMSPSSLCCSLHGMNVRLPATQEVSVKVREEWTPVLSLAQQCGYTLDRQDTDMLIAAPFITCGITVKNGKHTLHLQIGDSNFTLACPMSPSQEPPLTPQPLMGSSHLPSKPSRTVSKTVDSHPWAPPFFLAPPYYPHPTYRHRNPTPQEAYTSSTDTSSTPEPTIDTQSHPLDGSQQADHDHSHQNSVKDLLKYFDAQSLPGLTDPEIVDLDLQGLSEQHGTAGSPVQVQTATIQPPSHAFNSYYHYYHHPKILQSDPPGGSDPGLVALEELSPKYYNMASTELFRVNQQSEAETMFSQSPHRYPYHYYDFPHSAWNDSNSLPLLYPQRDMTTKSSDSHAKNMRRSHVSAPPWPSVSPARELEPSLGEPGEIEKDPLKKSNSKLIQSPLFAGDEAQLNYMESNSMPESNAGFLPSHDTLESDTPHMAPFLKQAFLTTHLSDHPSPHVYPHHPHRYNQMYPVAPPSQHPPKQSPFQHISIPLTTEEMDNVQKVQAHPYLHHLYYPVNVHSEKETASSESWPLYMHPNFISQQQPYDFFEHAGGEEDKLDETIDKSFASFHPEGHLPLSYLQGRQVYLEVRLLDPQEPDLMLLVHSCVASTQPSYHSYILIDDCCPSRGASQLLPLPHIDPHHIRKILISHFLSLPLHIASMNYGMLSHLDDPEVPHPEHIIQLPMDYFKLQSDLLCVTEVCSAAEHDCVVGCIRSPTSDV